MNKTGTYNGQSSEYRLQDGEDAVLSMPGPRDFPELSKKPWHLTSSLLNGYRGTLLV